MSCNFHFPKGSDYIKETNWTDEEISILRDNYSKLSKPELMDLLPGRTWSSILTKANKLKILKRYSWTKEEDALLTKIYPSMDIENVLEIFKNRTYDAIINHARVLGLNSYNHIIWTPEQEEFIIKNWEIYPDVVIANKIGKTKDAVKRKRNLLGLHRQDKNQRTYENINKFLRGNIWQWKKDSMEKSNYCCVLTGSKEFDIHHLYPMNKMVNNIFLNNDIPYKELEQYTQSELNKILDLFIQEQNKYPLGECVRSDIHQLFHNLYGQYSTTILQWEQFKKDYKNGIYENYNDIHIVA